MVDPVSMGVATVTDALSSLPAPVRASFFKALDDLLGGLTAIPAAKLKQFSQGIEDTTTARSTMVAAMSKAAAEAAGNDPLLVQAAVEIFIPSNLRKAKNRLNVAQNATKHIVENVEGGASGDGATCPDDDWMNTFMRFAEDASSERIQDLFGRLLAGQILRPGAFGLATLRALSELDQAIAIDFSHAWAKSVGDAVDYCPEWHRGDGFSRWKRLSEVGLMAPTSVNQFLPKFRPVLNGNGLWSPMHAGVAMLNVGFQENSTVAWEHIEFTRIGREIGSLLPKPNYGENMRQAANRLPKHGLTIIFLHDAGKQPEVIWQATP